MYSESDPYPEATEDAEAISCEVEPERGSVRVRPLGALDMATAPVLDRQLGELREAGFRRLILDLGGLSFMDSTGLRLALRWNAAAQRDGFEIGFVPGSTAVQRVFELTGTSEVVRFIGT